jgi:hypothetical protein
MGAEGQDWAWALRKICTHKKKKIEEAGASQKTFS